MKASQILLLSALAGFSERLQAVTNDVAPELLAYNLRTTLDAYDKAGRKNPQWDAEAKACLKAFAQIRSMTNDVPAQLLAELRTNLTRLVALKCDDPMLRYLHTRYILSANQSAAQIVPAFAEVASALEKSDYPAVRKFYARMWVYRATAEAGTEKDPYGLLEQAAPFLAEALQDKNMPQYEAATSCQELMTPPWWSHAARWNCYRILEPALTNNWDGSSFAQLAKGRAYLTYGWKARGTGYADTVSDQGRMLLAERLDTAAKALEKAWELNPHDPDICLEMIRVILGQGTERERMETWFKRGMKSNPASWNICYAKLEYLRPRWYGTVPNMIDFGWQCMTNADWSGEVRLGLANAHYEVAREMPDNATMYAYLAKTNVWSDIRTNFEYFFKLYPREVGYRHNYAKFAAYARDGEEFMRQVKMFPSTNFAYFGGVERFNRLLETARQHSQSEKEGK
jgi:hypothetical protein